MLMMMNFRRPAMFLKAAVYFKISMIVGGLCMRENRSPHLSCSTSHRSCCRVMTWSSPCLARTTQTNRWSRSSICRRTCKSSRRNSDLASSASSVGNLLPSVNQFAVCFCCCSMEQLTPGTTNAVLERQRPGRM